MSKINRATFIQFGVNVNAAADICEFGTPATGSPVYTTTIATLQANSAWTTGWAAETISSNRPFLEDMNAVCYVFSYMLAYLMEMGIPEYDASTTYYTNSIVQYSGTLYQSIADSNTGNTPAVGSYWKLLISLVGYGALNTSSYSVDGGPYQAATDGIVQAWVASTPTNDYYVTLLGYNDTVNASTFVLGTTVLSNEHLGVSPNTYYGFITFTVKKGEYFKVTSTAQGNSGSYSKGMSFRPSGS